jgi:hypothetical protein
MADRAYLVIQNDHDEATLATSLAPRGVGYEAERTQNAIRDDEFATTNLSAQTLTGTWAAPKTVNHFSVHQHGLYGATLRFQCGAYDSGVVDVADFTVPAIVVAGYTDSDGSADPYAHESSFWLDFPEQTDDAYTLTFGGTPRDWGWFWLSRIWVGKSQWFEHTAVAGYQWSRETQSKAGRTFGGSRRVNRGESYRRASFDFNAITTDEAAVLEDMQRRCDIGGDLIANLFAGEGSRRERNQVFAGTLAQISPLTLNQSRAAIRFQMEEN